MSCLYLMLLSGASQPAHLGGWGPGPVPSMPPMHPSQKLEGLNNHSLYIISHCSYIPHTFSQTPYGAESCSGVSMSYREAISSLAFHTSLFLKLSEPSPSPYELTCPCNESHWELGQCPTSPAEKLSCFSFLNCPFPPAYKGILHTTAFLVMLCKALYLFFISAHLDNSNFGRMMHITEIFMLCLWRNTPHISRTRQVEVYEDYLKLWLFHSFLPWGVSLGPQGAGDKTSALGSTDSTDPRALITLLELNTELLGITTLEAFRFSNQNASWGRRFLWQSYSGQLCNTSHPSAAPGWKEM